ncbi:MAG: diadenylate cyclase CdaA [Rikenellaceae bacterium]|nr:diadenylate cyclase CdaA [Rikenellaceae bacterium]MCL2692178.1 diadenylate cyclase CdaA [Rikenellaceae bacterium]
MGFITINFIDILDILVVALIMYYVYRIARGTPAPSILLGILLIYLIWFVVRALGMELLSEILGSIISVGVIALIVVFQPEIRRFLQVLGNRGMRRRNKFWDKLLSLRDVKTATHDYVPSVAEACAEMSASRTGALILIQRRTELAPIAETGVAIDAHTTAPLLRTIFFKNSPLHDGAVIINDGRIMAARCILPSTEDTDVPVFFGMRHRAAMGASEATDAVIVVISEQTGAISIAHNGRIERDIAPDALRGKIVALLKS